MSAEKKFKYLILFHFLFLVLTSIWDYFFVDEILIDASIQLTEFSYLEYDIFLIFLIIILILYLVCLFLLYRFIKFAKNLYIFLVLITFVAGFFVGISVYEPTGLFLTDLFVLSQGAIIYCLLFTDIKNKF